ncbi:MAG: tRNA-dihydrouridine synthase family protein [Candidatus Thermoplasmatota archaeon]|nr:tRNA-dihydrouridine synthase family protein [Candidatus Thermoplasmatota archaeon]
MSAVILPSQGVWEGEKRQLFLAPMSGVSELPYRLLAKECGADITITEFTSSSALTREVTKSWARVESHKDESPFIPQIFGGNPEEMVQAAKMLDNEADVIDLNFGCPAPKVTKICAGAALMGQPDDLVEMTASIIENVQSPVTAKMRLGTGSGHHNVLEISKRLEEIGVKRICVHGRTLNQKYRGEADWGTIAEVVEEVDIPVIANGDIVDTKSAKLCLELTNAAGLMIGRGAIGRPNIFAEIKVGLGWEKEENLPWFNSKWFQYSDVEKQFTSRHWCWNRYVDIARETTGLRPNWLKRHAVAFTKGLPGAKKVRGILHLHQDSEKLADAISKYLKSEN